MDMLQASLEHITRGIMNKQHKRQQDKPHSILFFVLVLLLGQLGIEQPLPVHAAVGNSSDNLRHQAPQDYSRPPPRAVKGSPFVIPKSYTALNQTSTYATFVEAENTNQVIYGGSGWSNLPCQYCSGGQYRRSNSTGHTATFTFNGTTVSAILVGDARSGIVTVTIDKVSYPSINLFNNAAGAESDPIEYVIATNLPPGQHTLQLKVSGQNGYNYRLSATQVGIDGFRYGTFPFGSLHGRVLDPDGDGIPGAQLSIASGLATYTVQAGSDGLFNLSGLPSSTYTLTAFAQNYTAQVINGVAVTAGSETAGINITLPEAAGHPLFGRIYLPHSNNPAIQPAGTTLNIKVKTGSNAGGWSASLSTAYDTISLSIVSASYDPITAWTLQTAIPAGTPAELYNLTVSSNLSTDTQVRAVQVVAQYGDPFYFVVLGDPQAATIEAKQPIFKRIVDEINLINPAFVLVVGDLTENGSSAQFEAYQAAINRLRVPSYAIAGNHDFAHEVGSLGQIQEWGLWKKYFGRRFYSFDYGPYHLVGMDNSMLQTINPDLADIGGYFADQVAWAKTDLAAHQNSLLRFLFLHIIRQTRSADEDLVEWKPTWIDQLRANMVFYGHAGADYVEVSGNTPVHWVETRDMIKQGYRLVRIDHGVIGPYTYQDDNYDAIPSGSLELKFSPASDGQHDTVTATINNPLREHFEHASLRFVMPRQGCYQTNNGSLTQLVHSDDGRVTVVYVTLDVPATSKMQVKVTPCIGPDLTLTQSVSTNSVIAGNNLTYTLTIANKGPLLATGVTLTNTLPASVTLTSPIPSNCAQVEGKVICHLGNLAQNNSTKVSLQVVIDPSARGNLTNLATVAGFEYDPKAQNNTSIQNTPIKAEANLSISQTALPNPVVAGNNLTYHLTIANNGPSTATGMTLTNSLPTSITFVSASLSNCQKISNKVICKLTDLLPQGSSPGVTIRVTVDKTTNEAFTNLATVVGNEPDPETANNATQQEVTVTDIYQSYLPVLLK